MNPFQPYEWPEPEDETSVCVHIEYQNYYFRIPTFGWTTGKKKTEEGRVYLEVRPDLFPNERVWLHAFRIQAVVPFVAPVEDEWQEHHLPDGTIRGAITAHLRASGYEVKPGTLRIYGYGNAQNGELSAFQGHLETRPATRANSLKNVE